MKHCSVIFTAEQLYNLVVADEHVDADLFPMVVDADGDFREQPDGEWYVMSWPDSEARCPHATDVIMHGPYCSAHEAAAAHPRTRLHNPFPAFSVELA